MLHAVIMAGGSGTRFWPESRAALPKQLLNLTGERTMIQATLDRLGTLVPADRVLIATNQRLVDALAAQLPDLPEAAYLGEPCKRDTAPCIGMAAGRILRDDPQATMVVMPSDHVIAPDDVFQKSLRFAADLVEADPARLVTFGIKPTYPAESFGYIEAGEPLTPAAGAPAVFRVARFREKPRAEQAQEFLAAGGFYWNSGIFVWKAQTVLDEIARREPQMHAHLERITAAVDTPAYQDVLAREFAAINGKSIDYAVMEHADDVAVIEAPFEWDDVGSWQSLSRLRGTDAEGNTVAARHLGLNTTGSILRGRDDHLIVTLGITDCIVVQTPDATLVANKHDEESIRQIVKMIEERGWKEYL